jgi:archaellum component FlaF (FlaF/FlaG flagellin family)
MLSYNFQVNKSVSSLFVVVKNYGNRSVSVSEVTFDGVLVDGSRVTLDNGCVDFASGSECGITLLLGPPSQPLSVEGSGHSIVIIMRDGTQLSYQVTAGELYHAACTYTSSC